MYKILVVLSFLAAHIIIIIIVINIIIITIFIIISFIQGIYTYIPETNYVPMEHSVAAILLLLFVVLISLVSVLNLLYFYEGNSISKLQIQVVNYVFELSAGNCHRQIAALSSFTVTHNDRYAHTVRT